MEIKIISLGHIRTNCYLISDEKSAVVIDPGFKSSEVEDFLRENEGKERLILLTHAHFDHIGGASFLREDTGVKIAIGKDDNADLSNPEINLSNKFHAKVTPFEADILLNDGEAFKVGDLEFKVIATSGHTIGGVSYLLGDILFSGDTLFKNSVGRTDFLGGDHNLLMQSVSKLLKLSDDTVVLSGHGEKTTIGDEKKYNPFVIN